MPLPLRSSRVTRWLVRTFALPWAAGAWAPWPPPLFGLARAGIAAAIVAAAASMIRLRILSLLGFGGLERRTKGAGAGFLRGGRAQGSGVHDEHRRARLGRGAVDGGAELAGEGGDDAGSEAGLRAGRLG